ncbi:hypothetical protein HYW68_01970 [Candidatus Parcubacteria bacterium]|nr:hypothetical protein [Candidatus Parcubacteria bacterium]
MGIGIAAVALTVALAGALVPVFSGANVLTLLLRVEDLADTRVLALALAFSLASFFNAIALYLVAARDLRDGFHREVTPALTKMFGAAGALVLVTYGGLKVLAAVVNMQSTLGVFTQGVGAAVMGLAAYGVAAYALGCREMMIVAPVVRRLAFWREFVPAAIREEEDLR